MRKLLLIFAIILISGYLSANDFSKLLGTWNYKVEYAPQGYDKGQMVFAEKEGKVVGEVKIEGYSIPVKNLEVVEGEYKFGVEIDYGLIPVYIKIEGDKLTGRASTPEGDMPVTGTKVVEEK